MLPARSSCLAFRFLLEWFADCRTCSTLGNHTRGRSCICSRGLRIQAALHSCCHVTCRLQQRQRRRIRLPHLFEHLSASGKASERLTCLENPIHSLMLSICPSIDPCTNRHVSICAGHLYYLSAVLRPS